MFEKYLLLNFCKTCSVLYKCFDSILYDIFAIVIVYKVVLFAFCNMVYLIKGG